MNNKRYIGQLVVTINSEKNKDLYLDLASTYSGTYLGGYLNEDGNFVSITSHEMFDKLGKEPKVFPIYKTPGKIFNMNPKTAIPNSVDYVFSIANSKEVSKNMTDEELQEYVTSLNKEIELNRNGR